MCVPTESACVFEQTAAAATVEFGTKRVEMAVGGKKGAPEVQTQEAAQEGKKKMPI